MKRQFAIIRYSGHRKGRVVEKHIATDTGIVVSVFNKAIGRSDLNFIINITPGLDDGEQFVHIADRDGNVILHRSITVKK